MCGVCYVKLEKGCRSALPPKQEPESNTSMHKAPAAQKRKGIRSPQKTPSTTRQTKNICLAPPSHPSRFVPRSASTPVRLEFTETSKQQALHKALISSQYYTAFRNILTRGTAAKKAFIRLVKNTVADEVKAYSKQRKDDLNYPQLSGMKDVANFTWDAFNEDVNQKMPTFYSCLDGALNCKLRRRKKHPTEQQMAKHR